jgi:hypothetical protein
MNTEEQPTEHHPEYRTIEPHETGVQHEQDPAKNPGPRGNPELDREEVQRGEEKFERIVGN